MARGEALYGKGTWEKIPKDEHLAHATAHLTKYEEGDTTEDHLAHAACRLMGALNVDLLDQIRKALGINPANSKDTDGSDTGQQKKGRAKIRGKHTT